MNSHTKTQDATRLAELRAQWESWSATTDTSTWESTFFFGMFDRQNQEIAALRRALRNKRSALKRHA